VLVVAATRMELDFVEGADTLCCGIGPVEAALATARALARARPAGLLHIGLAGARALPAGSVVIGSEAVYADLETHGALRLVDRERPDARLLAVARAALPMAHVLPIATSASVGGGREGTDVEAMEGFAVLRAAALAGIPAIELRAVSNTFDDVRADWRIDDALAELARSVPILLAAFDA
jgi:nucleoside phosphorylase